MRFIRKCTKGAARKAVLARPSPLPVWQSPVAKRASLALLKALLFAILQYSVSNVAFLSLHGCTRALRRVERRQEGGGQTVQDRRALPE